MTQTIEEILKERGDRYNTYGTYKDFSVLAQRLKNSLRSHTGWNEKPAEVRESLDMLCHKMARIVNGDHTYQDNWDDIEGYSKLALKKD